MKVRLVGAEKHTSHGQCGAYHSYLHTKFNVKTGARQYVREFSCPKRKGWFSKHDQYELDEVVAL
jgi:hypothetical protein